MGGSSCSVIGYRYYMGLHFGICHGPVDAITEIRTGDRVAWSGAATSNSQISINQPELFGGDEREGGIVGALDVMMGGTAQTANDYLTAQQGSPQPAYRGMLGAVFRGGMISAMNPYVKAWAWKVRRTLQGWEGGTAWYSAKAEITLTGGEKAANPAHIIYECLTNTLWGMGYSSGMIDSASFTAAADQFYSEGMGLCIQWSRQDSIEHFIQTVTDHVGAVVGQDPTTGLFVIKTIRGGYDVSTLTLFDPSNTLELMSFQRASLAETINEVTVVYTDLANGGKDASVTLQNLAAVQSQGGVVSQTRQYPGLATATLAIRVAERDLRAGSSPLAKVRLRINRKGYRLMPGGLIRFTWPKLGITDMPLRILKVDYGDMQSGAITVDAAEDVFGLPSTSYAAQQPSGWQAPNTTAYPASYYDVFEAPYRDLVIALGQATAETLDVDASYMMAVAMRPAGLSLRFDMKTRVSPADYADRGSGYWTPTGTLQADIGYTATSVQLLGAKDLDQIEVGSLGLIGTEIVKITSVDTGTSTVGIARGCVDTVPKSWAAGTRFWGYQWHGQDPTEYTTGETVDAKFITRTTTDVLAEGSAPIDSVAMTGRQGKPYPPGKLRINNLAYPASITGSSISLTWQHRDRKLQADQIVDESASSIGPEVGTTYTARVKNVSGGTLMETSGITGTTKTFNFTEARYFRLNALTVAGPSTLELSEIRLYNGGSAVDASATMTSSSAPATGSLANLKDGNTATLATWAKATAEGAGFWIAWDAGVGNTMIVSALRLGGGTDSLKYLSSFTMQASLDGATWATVATVSSLAYPGNNTLSGDIAVKPSSVTVELESVRDAKVSHQKHSVTVAVT